MTIKEALGTLKTKFQGKQSKRKRNVAPTNLALAATASSGNPGHPPEKLSKQQEPDEAPPESRAAWRRFRLRLTTQARKPASPSPPPPPPSSPPPSPLPPPPPSPPRSVRWKPAFGANQQGATTAPSAETAPSPARAPSAETEPSPARAPSDQVSPQSAARRSSDQASAQSATAAPSAARRSSERATVQSAAAVGGKSSVQSDVAGEAGSADQLVRLLRERYRGQEDKIAHLVSGLEALNKRA